MIYLAMNYAGGTQIFYYFYNPPSEGEVLSARELNSNSNLINPALSDTSVIGTAIHIYQPNGNQVLTMNSGIYT